MSHVVVVGAGIGGLTAAYFAIKAGHSVTVLEASSRVGGAVQFQVVETSEGPLGADVGAEAYASRSRLVEELMKDLGLANRLVSPNPAGSWLYLPEIGAVPAPKLGMWGIPGDPHAAEVVAALGPEAAARAAQELDLPMDTWARRRAAGESITVGELVAHRFGPTVLERLVAPVVSGVHSADPYGIDIDTIAPGLIEKSIEYGSVAKAIAALRAAAPPGAAVKSLRGGMQKLVDALTAYVQTHGQLRLRSNVVALDARARTVHVEYGDLVQADHIVLALDAPTAHDVVSTITPFERPALLERPDYGAGVGLVMLALDSPALDAHPRGTGMLVSPSVADVVAKAATHVTAKWGWARDVVTRLSQHRHIVRLSYGRITDPSDRSAPGYATPEDALSDIAFTDLATLFDLPEQHVLDNIVGVDVARWRAAMPLTTPQNVQRINAVRQAVEHFDWLHVTGAWFAGTGIAAISQHSSALSINRLQ